MRIEEQIENQKALISKLEIHLEINRGLLNQPSDSQEGTELLHSIVRQILIYDCIDMDIKLGVLRKKLADLEQYYANEYQVSFEKMSRECNLNIENCIKRAIRVSGDILTPKVIADNIKNLIAKYELEKDSIDQYDKNGLYDSINKLIGLIK